MFWYPIPEIRYLIYNVGNLTTGEARMPILRKQNGKYGKGVVMAGFLEKCNKHARYILILIVTRCICIILCTYHTTTQ